MSNFSICFSTVEKSEEVSNSYSILYLGENHSKIKRKGFFQVSDAVSSFLSSQIYSLSNCSLSSVQAASSREEINTDISIKEKSFKERLLPSSKENTFH
jgi:hypothetical protein